MESRVWSQVSPSPEHIEITNSWISCTSRKAGNAIRAAKNRTAKTIYSVLPSLGFSCFMKLSLSGSLMLKPIVSFKNYKETFEYK